jgi:carbon storage regulator CsrA
MFVTTRRAGDRILIDGKITITVTEVYRDGRVVLGIEAPREIPIEVVAVNQRPVLERPKCPHSG